MDGLKHQELVIDIAAKNANNHLRSRIYPLLCSQLERCPPQIIKLRCSYAALRNGPSLEQGGNRIIFLRSWFLCGDIDVLVLSPIKSSQVCPRTKISTR